MESNNEASLARIADSLERIERKLDQLPMYTASAIIKEAVETGRRVLNGGETYDVRPPRGY